MTSEDIGVTEYPIDLTLTATGEHQAALLEAAEEVLVTDVTRGLEETHTALGPALGEKMPSGDTVTIEAEGLMGEVTLPPDTEPVPDDAALPSVEERAEFVYPDESESIVHETYHNVVRRIDFYEERFDVRVNQLVLGEPQYLTLTNWLDENDAPQSIDDWFGVHEVIVVPGPQIHPVVPHDCWMED